MPIIEENEEKKKYLKGYIYCKRREKQLAQQIDELRNQKMFPSVNNDGMPHGSGISDLSGSVGHFLRTVHTCYPFLFSAPAFALV